MPSIDGGRTYTPPLLMANQHNFPLIGQAFLGTQALSANHAITGVDSGKAFHNLPATGSITISLPKATPGTRFKFLEASAHNMVITPIASDTIRGSAMGASTTLSGLGQFLEITCVVTGFWELF